MISSFDILSALYQILNISEVNDKLSGKIYIGDIPDADQKDNISIKTLSNPNRYLQNGFINLNIHVKEISSGRSNLAKFKQIINAVIPLVEDVKHQQHLFQIDDDKGVFKDREKDSMYFYNLKLNFKHYKKMAKEDNIRGVEKIEIGLPGNGVVGTNLTQFKAVVLNSLSLTGGEANEETIKTEQDDSYLSINTASTPATSTFKLYEVAGAGAVMLLGGSWDVASKTWSAPKIAPDKHLSVVITDIVGNKITFPYAKVAAKFDGNITKGELLSVNVIITANTPIATSGTEGAPYEVVFAE